MRLIYLMGNNPHKNNKIPYLTSLVIRTYCRIRFRTLTKWFKAIRATVTPFGTIYCHAWARTKDTSFRDLRVSNYTTWQWYTYYTSSQKSFLSTGLISSNPVLSSRNFLSKKIISVNWLDWDFVDPKILCLKSSDDLKAGNKFLGRSLGSKHLNDAITA